MIISGPPAFVRRATHALSTRLYGPRDGCNGFTWVGDERIAIGALPVGTEVWNLGEHGFTHAVNCRATFQVIISQDLWAERRALGGDRVVHAPMWDHGRPQMAGVWGPAALFIARALDTDPEARALIHCQQGRRRSAMVAYAVLRLRGHSEADASRLILEHRLQAQVVPVYRAGVEAWLATQSTALQ